MPEKTEKKSVTTTTEHPKAPPPQPVDHIVVTHHRATIGGRMIAYTVTTGTLVLKEESEKKGEQEGEAEGEKPKAQVFFIAYTLRDGGDPARRPVTFSFNGGPGSASVWLHLGVLGPKRVDLGEIGELPPPPFRLIDNDSSLLDETDLVFIDPVTTGYSRAVVGEKNKDFLAFKKDIESVGDFIRLYTTRYRRWLSPKFLIGESYGSTRAAGLSGYLQERHGLYLNGIMLVSCVLDFQTLDFQPMNDLPYVLFLPSYTATAWYHRRLSADLQKDLQATLRKAEAFARDEYAPALMRNDTLSARERSAVVAKLARFTGLSAEYIERTNLRVEIHRFTKELLRDQRRTVGRLDSRITGVDRDAAGDAIASDPSANNIIGPYTATFNDYVRGELRFESDLPYEILNFKTNEAWRFQEHENRFVEVAETLRRSISMNPHLKVFVANGYYDLATPYFATEYTFNRLGLEPSLRGNVTQGFYEAGHMMYIHRPSLVQMKRDLSRFLEGALAPGKGSRTRRAPRERSTGRRRR
ncbi:MAG TPA: peptidase S10 [Candidatus Eisenbacteria bacterium]|nr:peptidase S10 [Candidatus Eisenbacteria bacterium]